MASKTGATVARQFLALPLSRRSPALRIFSKNGARDAFVITVLRPLKLFLQRPVGQLLSFRGLASNDELLAGLADDFRMHIN